VTDRVQHQDAVGTQRFVVALVRSNKIMQKNRRSGNGWIGWLIFIFLVFGSRFLPPVANWLTQVTGLPISTPILVAVLVGLVVVVSIVNSVVQAGSRNSSPNETSLPTGLPPSTPQKPMPPSRTPTLPSPSSSGRVPRIRPPSGESRMPGPPRFEPIIDPRILAFGIIGLVIFGGIFIAVFLFSSPLP
jgi:hypothetical protein